MGAGQPREADSNVLIVEGSLSGNCHARRLRTLLPQLVKCDILDPEEASCRLRRSPGSPSYRHVFLDRLPYDCAQALIGVARSLRPAPNLVVLDPFLSVVQIAELSQGRVIALRELIDDANVRALVSVLEQSVVARLYVQTFAGSKGLTKRETEVVLAAFDGLNDKEVAAMLGCSEGTLKTHWRRIRAKYGVHSQRDVFAMMLRTCA